MGDNFEAYILREFFNFIKLYKNSGGLSTTILMLSFILIPDR